jgi:hypothetical protein
VFRRNFSSTQEYHSHFYFRSITPHTFAQQILSAKEKNQNSKKKNKKKKPQTTQKKKAEKKNNATTNPVQQK